MCKKDGSICICVDFPRLNFCTMKNTYAIPRIEDSLHLLVGFKFFTKLDLKVGYLQVGLKSKDKHNSAFKLGTLDSMSTTVCHLVYAMRLQHFRNIWKKTMGDLHDCLIYLV